MNRSPHTRYEFDSAAIKDGEAFGCYHDLYACGTDVQRTGPEFRARFEVFRLGPLVLFDRRLNDVAHERTAARVRSDGFSHVTLQLVLSGRMAAEEGDRRHTVGPGEIVVFDLTRPQRTTAFDTRLLTFSVPRDLVERSGAHLPDLHGRVLPPARSGLLADVMASIVTRQFEAPTLASEPAVDVLGAALALALQLKDARAPRARDAADVLDRVRLVIEANLSRRDLSPTMVSKLAGVSRSVLYEMHKPFGGIARYIQQRRVVRLRSLIQRSDLQAVSISRLAARAGFSSDSHANRSFADAYGTTPGRFRTENGRGLVSIEPVTRPCFHDWIRALS